MVGRQSSPYTGKLSARPAGKPGHFSSLKEIFATIPSTPPIPQQPTIILGAQYAFLKAWRNLSVRCGHQTKPEPRPTASRRSAPTQVGERVGRTTLFPSSAMSSGRLFLDRVGRHQSPSPLRRHAQTTTHFPRGHSKPELSTLLGSGTFYFALTPATVREQGFTPFVMHCFRTVKSTLANDARKHHRFGWRAEDCVELQ
jgi:hypothetical protein